MYQLRGEKNLGDIVVIYGRSRELFRPPTYIIELSLHHALKTHHKVGPWFYVPLTYGTTCIQWQTKKFLLSPGIKPCSSNLQKTQCTHLATTGSS